MAIDEIQILWLRARSLMDQADAAIAAGRDTRVMRDQMRDALINTQMVINQLEEEMPVPDLVSDEWLKLKKKWGEIIAILQRNAE